MINMKINESWYIRPKGVKLRVRIGAGGVIVRCAQRKLLVCLVKADYWKDYILPKGGMEDGETPLKTAIREIGEETGLNQLKMVKKLGIRQRMGFSKEYWSKMHYFLFLTEQVDGKATDPNECYRPQWFEIDNLPPMFWPEQKELIEGNKQIIKSLFKREDGIL